MVDISINIHIYISLIIIVHHHHTLTDGLLRETQVFGGTLTFEVEDKAAAWGSGSRAMLTSRTFHSDETVLKEAISPRSF